MLPGSTGLSVDENSVSPSEDIKPVVQVDNGRPCTNTLTHTPPPSVTKPFHAPETHPHSQQFNNFSRSSALRIAEETKPVVLPPDDANAVVCSVSSHLKLPSTRAMHMDMRYNPYPRPGFPVAGMPSGFMPHAHGHMYPPYGMSQAAFPPCQVSQNYPPCTANQQGFGYPAAVSSIGMASGGTASEMPTSFDLHCSDRTSAMGHRTN